MQPQEPPAPKGAPSTGGGCSHDQSQDAPGPCEGTRPWIGGQRRGAGAAESPARPLLVSPASPPSPGCPTEWDGVSCWPALPLGQSRAVACPDILNVFKNSKGLNPAGIAHPMGPTHPARAPCAPPAVPSDPTAPASPKQMPVV